MKDMLAMVGFVAIMFGAFVAAYPWREQLPLHTWQLPGGEAIGCAMDPVTDECGITLRACGYNRTTTLACLSNVHYVGPTEEQVP